MIETAKAAPTRRLNIERCEPITEGTTQDGRAWTMRRVIASDKHGRPIGHELITFEDLDPGEGDYTVQRRDHEKYGVSYAIRRTRARLVDRVAELERRVAALEAAASRH